MLFVYLQTEWPSQMSSATSSARDFESLVLHKLRQAEERKRLIEQMQKEDGEGWWWKKIVIKCCENLPFIGKTLSAMVIMIWRIKLKLLIVYIFYACWDRMKRLRIFPLGDFGMWSVNTTPPLSLLYGATCSVDRDITLMVTQM